MRTTPAPGPKLAAMLAGSHARATVWSTAPHSGRGSVARNPGRRGLVRRWKRKGSTVRKAASSIQATYSSAGSSPASGNLRQFATRLGKKVRTICQRNPRRGLCVPTNQTPRIAPVHTPRSGRKKPRRKRQATAQARICRQRMDWTLLDILWLHGGKHRQGSFAPFQCGADLRNTEAVREHPERKMGMVPMTRASQSFNLQQGGEQTLEPVLKLPYVADGDAGRGLAAKEQLEQELIARRIVAVRDGQPLLQACAAGSGQAVLPALRPGPRGCLARFDQAFGCQPLEGGVDLAVALAPEVADAAFDGLVDVVAGLVGLDGEQAENDVSCLVALHIS